MLQYVNSTLKLLSRLSSERRNGVDAEVADNILLNAIDVFVRQGFLAEVKNIIPTNKIPPTVRAELHSRFMLLLGRADDFGLPPILAKDNYSDDIVQWLNSFQPRDLVEELIVQVSSSSWDHHGKELEWRKALALLAKETFVAYHNDRVAFEEVLSWLHSEKARGAFNFGFELGKIDEKQNLFGQSLEYRYQHQPSGLDKRVGSRLYREVQRECADVLNARLDVLQTTNPQMAFYVAQAILVIMGMHLSAHWKWSNPGAFHRSF